MLLNFNIVAYIRENIAIATNVPGHKGVKAYTVIISGLDQLITFSNDIGFISDGKNDKLLKYIDKTLSSSDMSNLCTIPGLCQAISVVDTEIRDIAKASGATIDDSIGRPIPISAVSILGSDLAHTIHNTNRGFGATLSMVKRLVTGYKRSRYRHLFKNTNTDSFRRRRLTR